MKVKIKIKAKVKKKAKPIHPYAELVSNIKELLIQAHALDIPHGLSKGRIGEILLAHHLNHRLDLSLGDKGADAIDSKGRKFEYKVSFTDKFNFNFGHGNRDAKAAVENHFRGLEGVYCAKASISEIDKVVFCPSEVIVPFLIKYFKTRKFNIYNKVLRMKALEKLIANSASKPAPFHKLTT
jgi:hypothetical protein